MGRSLKGSRGEGTQGGKLRGAQEEGYSSGKVKDLGSGAPHRKTEIFLLCDVMRKDPFAVEQNKVTT